MKGILKTLNTETKTITRDNGASYSLYERRTFGEWRQVGGSGRVVIRSDAVTVLNISGTEHVRVFNDVMTRAEADHIAGQSGCAIIAGGGGGGGGDGQYALMKIVCGVNIYSIKKIEHLTNGVGDNWKISTACDVAYTNERPTEIIDAIKYHGIECEIIEKERD